MHTAIAIDALIRLGQRVDDLIGFAPWSDVPEARPAQTAVAAQPVAGPALTLAPENLFAMGDIAGKWIVDRSPPPKRNAKKGADIANIAVPDFYDTTYLASPIRISYRSIRLSSVRLSVGIAKAVVPPWTQSNDVGYGSYTHRKACSDRLAQV